MNSHPFLAGLCDNPDFLLHNLDFKNRCGLVVKINEYAYRQTSFLDERVFNADTQGAWFPFETLLEATTEMSIQKAPHFIFHVGHCGSTLISRLLGELPQTLCLREPIAPLALAMIRREMGTANVSLDMETWQRLFTLSLTCLSRTYHINDQPIIKLTSAAGNLLEPVLEANIDSKALLLYVDLETWLAVMLRTKETRENLHAYSGAWLKDFWRLAGNVEIQLRDIDDTRRAVISWLTMMLTFQLAITHNPGRIQWLNFDDFLRSPGTHLVDLASFMNLRVPNEMIDSLTNSPIMGQYAKDPRQNFDTGVRAQELNHARQQFSAEISTGLEWFGELIRRIPMVLTSFGPRTSGA